MWSGRLPLMKMLDVQLNELEQFFKKNYLMSDISARRALGETVFSFWNLDFNIYNYLIKAFYVRSL